MRLVDANILLYAVNEDAPLHGRANAWLESALGSGETVGFAWMALLAFLRLSTRREVFRRPLEARQALDLIDDWIAQPRAALVHPTDRHAVVLRDLLGPLGTAGNLTNDAHLAALAIEHGALLCSTDRDFGRFPGLRHLNPLA